MTEMDDIIKDLQKSNKVFAEKNKKILQDFISGQNPKIGLITCSDSRVIPEKIFNKSIGEIFVVRIAGNVVADPTVISSLEYSVDHLDIQVIIILGHTKCGAINLAENSDDGEGIITDEIRKSFPLNDNHVKANITRQIDQLLKMSYTIRNKVEKNKLRVLGAIYNIETGLVEFI